MSRKPSSGSGRIKPSTSVSSVLLSPSEANTLFEEAAGKKPDGTPLALLGDNISLPSTDKGRVKVKLPKPEAYNHIAWFENSPPASFVDILETRGKEASAPPKLTELPLSSSPAALPDVRGPLVAKEENQLGQLQEVELAEKGQCRLSDEETIRPSVDSQAPSLKLPQDNISNDKAQEDTFQKDPIHSNKVCDYEVSIVEVLWVLCLTFISFGWATSRLAFVSVLSPFSFVRNLDLALIEVSKLWLLLASQYYRILRLITKKLYLILSIQGAKFFTWVIQQLINGLTWALQFSPWIETFKSTLQSAEGPAGHFSDQPKEDGGHQL